MLNRIVDGRNGSPVSYYHNLKPRVNGLNTVVAKVASEDSNCPRTFYHANCSGSADSFSDVDR